MSMIVIYHFFLLLPESGGCYLCALQNKPGSAVPCCAYALSLSLDVDAMKIYSNIFGFMDHVS